MTRFEYGDGTGVLVDVESEPLGVEWAAALYESYAADWEPNPIYAQTAHGLAERLEEDGWTVLEALPSLEFSVILSHRDEPGEGVIAAIAGRWLNEAVDAISACVTDPVDLFYGYDFTVWPEAGV